MENIEEKMEQLDGRLWYRVDFRTPRNVAVRWKNGSFCYKKELVDAAIAAEWPIYRDERVYTQMPWGSQHTSYRAVELTQDRSLLLSL